MAQLKALSEMIYRFQADVAEKKGGFLGCPFGNQGQEMARQDERIRRSLQAIFDAHCSYIESALDRAVDAGEIPRGDNRKRARNVFALLEGALLLAKVANDPDVFLSIQGTLPLVAGA
jgi:TetR/AcrR family transcriptional repressor of nem operon